MAESTNDQEKDLSVKFRFKGIEEIDYSVKTAGEEINEENFKPDRLAFRFNFGFHENRESEEFKILIEVSYMYGEEDEEKAEYVHSKVGVAYHIKEMESFLNEEKDEIHLPEYLMASLLGIAFSTVRGVISTRTRGTIWQKYPLPIINPTNILRESQPESDSED